MKHRYKNPWAISYEPQEYVRHVDPIEYMDCQIFHVYPMQFDTVKNGICIAQRASLDGAKYAAEIVSDLQFPSFNDVRERMFAEMR